MCILIKKDENLCTCLLKYLKISESFLSNTCKSDEGREAPPYFVSFSNNVALGKGTVRERTMESQRGKEGEMRFVHNGSMCFSPSLSFVLSLARAQSGRGKAPAWHCPVPVLKHTHTHTRGPRTYCPANPTLTSDWENTAVTITGLRK